MFAKMLVDEEKKSFISLLEYLSLVDGEITAEESKYIYSVAKEIDVDYTPSNSIDENTLDAILGSFQSNLSKNVVLIELVNIAFADQNYSEKEREGVLKIAKIMSIPDEKLIEMEKWVQDGLLWKEKGFKLLND